MTYAELQKETLSLSAGAHAVLKQEQLMLLNAWYTVMSHPPQCKVFLDNGDYFSSALSEFLRKFSGEDLAAQLTVGAIAAQICRVQLHLKAQGSTSSSFDLLKQLGPADSFGKWLTAFAQIIGNNSEVLTPNLAGNVE